jgi:opacity protein-like surface antigen
MWQFPVLVKYRLLREPFRPFISAGTALQWNRLSGNLTRTTISEEATVVTSTSQLSQSHVVVGWSVGGGVELKLSGLRLLPELRYTHFGDFSCGRCLSFPGSFPALNSAVVLFGVGF